jgi:predicted NUDIX family phosphoesterase
MSKNSKYQGEEILVVPRALFDDLGAFQGFQSDWDPYFNTLLDPDNNFFMDRAEAEDDPSHKQIIPYCVFHHNGQVLHYTRGKTSGESRLHAQGSVGVGGHINPIDAGINHLGQATYYAAVEREIDEELNIEGDHHNRIVGLINDDSNPVGQVHLGIVHLFELDSAAVSSNEDALANLAFQTQERLLGELFPQLETWSAHCVKALFGEV